jgi:hypothetical protein
MLKKLLRFRLVAIFLMLALFSPGVFARDDNRGDDKQDNHGDSRGNDRGDNRGQNIGTIAPFPCRVYNNQAVEKRQ